MNTKPKKSEKQEMQRLDIKKAVELALAKMPLGSNRERPENLAENSDSDDEAMKNRIGNVPLWWYKDEDHIGYDIYGNKIMRKDHGDSIDAFLARTDDPNAFRTVYDELNDEKIVLTDEELSIINRIRHGKFPHRDFDPYEEINVPLQVEVTSLRADLAPKSRFIPSKHEKKLVFKLIHSIRNGWLRDPRLPPKQKKVEDAFDIWGDSEDQASKPSEFLPPPSINPIHAESYNPPEEFLFNEKEKNIQENKDPKHRKYNFWPAKYKALRHIPAFQHLVTERYKRCMELFMAVRRRKNKRLTREALEAQIPDLPKPKDLKPFPSKFSLEYLGHTKIVRSIDADSTGQWLVSGSDDGTVRIWEISTARCVRIWNMYEPVLSVAFNPNPELPIVAVALTTGLALLHTGTGSPHQGAEVEHLLRAAPVFFKKAQEENDGIDASRIAQGMDNEDTDRQTVSRARRAAKVCSWVSWWNRTKSDQVIANEGLEEEKKQLQALKRNADDENDLEDPEEHDEFDTTDGLARLFIRINDGVKHVTWHHKGDYIATASPVATQTSVLIHRLSTAATQLPFGKSKGFVQKVLFHPTQPIFFVATQKQVRVFHLVAQTSIKKFIGNTKFISSIDIHPQGNHLIMGGYDRRFGWFDMDGRNTAFRSLRFHKKAVRSVSFHKKYPLFATASDDGDIHIYHSTVYDDYVTDPLIVPVKIIKAHVPKDDVGILECKFHPKQPWIFSCASDNSIRLFS